MTGFLGVYVLFDAPDDPIAGRLTIQDGERPFSGDAGSKLVMVGPAA